MELPAFDPIDFKKFTDGKTIVKVRSIQHPLHHIVTNPVLLYIGHRYGPSCWEWGQASYHQRHREGLRSRRRRHQGKPFVAWSWDYEPPIILETVFDIKLALTCNFCFSLYRLHAKSLKNKWIVNMDTLSIALWVRDSLLKWLDRRTKACTCTTRVNMPCSCSSAEWKEHSRT